MLRISLQTHSTTSICIFTRSHKKMLFKLCLMMSHFILYICYRSLTLCAPSSTFGTTVGSLASVDVWHKHEYNTNGDDLKGKFSSGLEGALASTLNHDFNCKQLSEIILCIFLLMFSKFI